MLVLTINRCWHSDYLQYQALWCASTLSAVFKTNRFRLQGGSSLRWLDSYEAFRSSSWTGSDRGRYSSQHGTTHFTNSIFVFILYHLAWIDEKRDSFTIASFKTGVSILAWVMPKWMFRFWLVVANGDSYAELALWFCGLGRRSRIS